MNIQDSRANIKPVVIVIRDCQREMYAETRVKAGHKQEIWVGIKVFLVGLKIQERFISIHTPFLCYFICLFGFFFFFFFLLELIGSIPCCMFFFRSYVFTFPFLKHAAMLQYCITQRYPHLLCASSVSILSFFPDTLSIALVTQSAVATYVHVR